MNPTQQYPQVQQQAGAQPITAQDFSGLAPFMLPDTYAKLRAAMMGAVPQQQQAQPAPMGYGG